MQPNRMEDTNLNPRDVIKVFFSVLSLNFLFANAIPKINVRTAYNKPIKKSRIIKIYFI
jgi:hypothetical protein